MKFIFALITGLFFLTTSSYALVIKDIKVNNNKRITKETIITYGNITPVSYTHLTLPTNREV